MPDIKPITIDGQTVDVNCFLKAAYDDVSEASQQLPALLEWVSETLQGYSESKLLSKRLLAEAEATAYFSLKRDEDGFSAHYPGKMTEDALKHAVNLEPAVKEAAREYISWDSWVDRLYNLQRSLQAKLELVRSSEATRRAAFEETPD